MGYFYTDTSSLPKEVTYASGDVRWRASYCTWGNALEERWGTVRATAVRCRLRGSGTRARRR